MVTAVPFFINTLGFLEGSALIFYQQRLDYSPGRLPLNDYHWLINFIIPLIVAGIYSKYRQPSPNKSVFIQSFAILGFSYVGVLHVRVLLGFIQAPDHFWRLSLGIPASLWCLAAIADLIRSRFKSHQLNSRVLCLMATALPFLLLARTAMEFVNFSELPDRNTLISAEQKQMIDKLQSFSEVLNPGEGFLTSEPELNYHVMANMKSKPYMAMGLSAVNIRTLSKRYLMSTYLTGKENTQFPSKIDRTDSTYIHAKDLNLYLYINLFTHSWSDQKLLKREENYFRNWRPETIDWSEHQSELRSVKAIYVNRPEVEMALPRINKIFDIVDSTNSATGVIYRVEIKGMNLIKREKASSHKTI
ncbi:hypothetical protein ACFL7E_08850 [Thermodesulfobacteriota bacterium]